MSNPKEKPDKDKSIELRYQNAAGRLLVIAQRLAQMPESDRADSCWIKALRCRSRRELYRCLVDLENQHAEALAFVEATEPADYFLLDPLREALTILVPDRFADQFNSHKAQFTNSGLLITLEALARGMPCEGDVEVSQIEEIRKKLEELRGAVIHTNDLAKPIRAWLLDLLRMMRDGLDRYESRGVRGLRADLCVLAGELQTRFPRHPNKEDKSSSSNDSQPHQFAKLWKQLSDFLDFYNDVTLAVIQTEGAIECGAAILGYIACN